MNAVGTRKSRFDLQRFAICQLAGRLGDGRHLRPSSVRLITKIVDLHVDDWWTYVLPSDDCGCVKKEKNAKNRYILGLPDALDLMVVCVEAGLA